MRPDLVLVAHGTRDPRGPKLLDRLAAAVRAVLPDVRVRLSYIELVPPLLADVTPTLTRPAVVVPLLLSTGYHVKHDLPEAVATAAVPVTLTPPLGPDRLLVTALAGRLEEAGALPGDPVVVAAAGSSDREAGVAVRRTATMLSSAWGGLVRCAYASMGVSVSDVMREVRSDADPARIALAPYLLAPGRFATKVSRAAEADNARVADILGTHPAVVDLIRRRYLHHADTRPHSPAIPQFISPTPPGALSRQPSRSLRRVLPAPLCCQPGLWI
jgi:sirohydrochlorin ferrochelatase